MISHYFTHGRKTIKSFTTSFFSTQNAHFSFHSDNVQSEIKQPTVLIACFQLPQRQCGTLSQ